MMKASSQKPQRVTTSSANALNNSSAFIARLKPDYGISEPVYRQLQRQIIDMILKGELSEGHSLPSERTLAEALNLSRTTVRRCYDELRSQDYISTHGRAGVMVRAIPERINPEIGRLKGFTQEMQELGLKPSTQLIERSITTDRTIASFFNRPSNNRFLKLVRVRLADDLPMTREVAWYDLTLAPELANWDVEGSAYAYLQEHCGLVLTEAMQTIEAALCNEEESQVFGFSEPSPCLLLKRKTHAATGQMVEYVEGTFRGDAYTYRITLRSF